MSMSSRARRMFEHQLRNKAAAELNLIPMIDILSVLVSFLLVYSTDVEVIQNSKSIEVPQSISEQRPHETVVVMLTKDDLFVQGERVAAVSDILASTALDIDPLLAALKRPQLVASTNGDKDAAEREITLMADKTLPYEVLKKVMKTCTDADYGKISLAVMQAEKAVDASKIPGLKS